ncbi:MAG: protein translocase subunit SecD [Clostridia bacterium]|nr:protein translocase subunit SecD [Clostridia bacterium]
MKSKRVGKPIFFVIFVLILALTYTAFFGIHDYFGDKKQSYIKGAEDIRWGIDISGGVEAVFSPDKEGVEITKDDMASAKAIIETRLVNLNITDYEVYLDNANHQVIVRFPRTAGDDDFDPQAAIKELGASAQLQFFEGDDNSSGNPFMTGEVVDKATGVYEQEHGWVVSLELNSKGAEAFGTATANAYKNGTNISIYMDETNISTASCSNGAITGGSAIIYGNFTQDQAVDLANKINAGSLPFALTVDDSKLQIISPSLGSDALRVMVIAGSIAFGVVCLLMLIRYRVHGFVACIALLGQLAGTIACISGYFPNASSFTLTVPGIAGIILSIGVGVDCNVIAAERIRDEFKKGKTIDGAIDSGFKNSLSAIIDGNVTIVIVSLVLMGAFGTPDSFIAKIFSPLMSLFGSSITGAIYSFGYTLLIGVIFNLIMGVLASKYMLKSISQLKLFRKPALYGGKKNDK